MKKHVLTTTQLRGMIKEALEESIQEIAIDEQIAALKAKGSKRTLQETKRYRKLLEMKMEGMDELAGGDESGMELEPRSELTTSRADVRRVLDAMQASKPVQTRLGKIDSDRERLELLSAFILDLTGGDEEASEKLLMRARSWLSQHTQEVEPETEEGSEVGREEGRMLNRMNESRRRLVRRGR